MTAVNRQEAFVESLVDYVSTNSQWDQLNKKEAVAFAVRALTTDPGAAKDFLDACGENIELYCMRCVNTPTGDPNQMQFKLD